jgi:hypothetical protein
MGRLKAIGAVVSHLHAKAVEQAQRYLQELLNRGEP